MGSEVGRRRNEDGTRRRRSRRRGIPDVIKIIFNFILGF